MRGALVLVIALSACGRFGFGATGDAGTSVGDIADDDASPDAPLDAAIDAPPGACKPSYRVCDGFEAPSLGTQWMVLGSASRDPNVAHSGAASVHFRTMPTAIGQDNYVDLTDTTTLGLGDPTLYVRAWIRTASHPLNNMGMISADQIGSNPREVAVFFLPGGLGVYSQFDNKSRNNMTLPPLDTWFCVIWQITRATTATGTMAISGDQPPVTQTGTITDGTPPLSELSLGIHFAGASVSVAQPGMDIWMDDVIASPTPVTCAD